jgi:hypothetical protein
VMILGETGLLGQTQDPQSRRTVRLPGERTAPIRSS